MLAGFSDNNRGVQLLELPSEAQKRIDAELAELPQLVAVEVPAQATMVAGGRMTVAQLQSCPSCPVTLMVSDFCRVTYLA